MQHRKMSWAVGTVLAGVVSLSAGTAFAGHDHFVVTPNGNCHQVAKGQTSITDPDHGGYHQYHVNVHQNATGGVDGAGGTGVFGDGHSKVTVNKTGCPA